MLNLNNKKINFHCAEFMAHLPNCDAFKKKYFVTGLSSNEHLNYDYDLLHRLQNFPIVNYSTKSFEIVTQLIINVCGKTFLFHHWKTLSYLFVVTTKLNEAWSYIAQLEYFHVSYFSFTLLCFKILSFTLYLLED